MERNNPNPEPLNRNPKRQQLNPPNTKTSSFDCGFQEEGSQTSGDAVSVRGIRVYGFGLGFLHVSYCHVRDDGRVPADCPGEAALRFGVMRFRAVSPGIAA